MSSTRTLPDAEPRGDSNATHGTASDRENPLVLALESLTSSEAAALTYLHALDRANGDALAPEELGSPRAPGRCKVAVLSAADVLRGYPFVARRLGIAVPASEPAVRAALDLARELANGAPAAEPAAVFFAFASYRRAFPGAWREMALMLAIGQARARGWVVVATGAELAALGCEVKHKRADFDRVRGCFETHLAPLR